MLLNTAETGSGGKPLVILHGLFGAARNWNAIGRRLSARHQVLAMDLRNHGASPRADAMDYASMAGDVAETMEAAGAAPAAVLGHSMGGKAAMALALTRPELVSRLLVADIAPVPYPPRQARIVSAMRSSVSGHIKNTSQCFAQRSCAAAEMPPKYMRGPPFCW